MARRILVVPVTAGAGGTAACLGLVQALTARRVPVAFAKPFEQARTHGEDQSTELFRLTMALRPPQPIPAADLERGLARGRVVETMADALALTAELDAANRVLVLEGLAPTAEQPAADRIDVELAQAYDAEVLLVGSAAGLHPEQLAERMAAAQRLHTVRGESRVVGAVVNRVDDPADAPRFVEALAAHDIRVVATVGHQGDLTHRRVSDVVRELGLTVVRDGELDRRVGSTAIIAQAAPSFLRALVPGRLLLVPGDRHEVLMGAALAEAGGTRLAAVLLTGGIDPDPAVLALCEAAVPSQLPVLATGDSTFETAQRVLQLSSEVPGDDEDRARRLMETFVDAYDTDWVDALTADDRPARVTPAEFRQRAIERTAAGITRIALSDGTDPRVLRAVCALDSFAHVRCVVVAPPAEVDAAAEAAGLTLPMDVRVVDPARAIAEHAAVVEAARARADVDLPADDPFVAALALQAAGEVDGVVGGIDLDRARAVATIGAFVDTRSDVVTPSAAQYVQMPDEVLVYADTALVGEPDAVQLHCIAAQTAESAEASGLEARVAFIRPSSSSPHAQEQRERIEEAMTLLRQRRPDLVVRGPVAYGRATSRVPGTTDGGENATVLVFPEIASATATVRAAAGTMGVRVYPPVLQGFSRAVNMIPRDAGVADVAWLVVATSVRASTFA